MAWGHAYARICDAHLAEDVCQEAFRAWLKKIVRTHADRPARKRAFTLVPYLDDTESVHGYGRPDEMLERVTRDPSVMELRGEQRSLSVLFADATDMAMIFETLSAEVAIGYFNEYLEAVYRAVIDEDGFMGKVVGDEILVFRGAPLSVENSAESACRAALATRARLLELSTDFKEAWTAGGESSLRSFGSQRTI